MVSVRLQFTPPDGEDISKLYIYESSDPDGPWSEIDSTEDVGTYPNYISHFTTQNALSAANWFRIAWADSNDYIFPASEAIQGGTETVVGEIVQRVMQRYPSGNADIVRQEAESVVEEITGLDPETLYEQQFSYRKLSGMVLLTLVRTYLTDSLTRISSGKGWTAGLVAMKADTATHELDVEALLKEANKRLGLNKSIVAVIEELPIAGGVSSREIAGALTSGDHSRLLGFVNLA